MEYWYLYINGRKEPIAMENDIETVYEIVNELFPESGCYIVKKKMY